MGQALLGERGQIWPVSAPRSEHGNHVNSGAWGTKIPGCGIVSMKGPSALLRIMSLV